MITSSESMNMQRKRKKPTDFIYWVYSSAFVYNNGKLFMPSRAYIYT